MLGCSLVTSKASKWNHRAKRSQAGCQPNQLVPMSPAQGPSSLTAHILLPVPRTQPTSLPQRLARRPAWSSLPGLAPYLQWADSLLSAIRGSSVNSLSVLPRVGSRSGRGEVLSLSGFLCPLLTLSSLVQLFLAHSFFIHTSLIHPLLPPLFIPCLLVRSLVPSVVYSPVPSLGHPLSIHPSFSPAFIIYSSIHLLIHYLFFFRQGFTM
jgi:hypothetical protein